MTLTDLAQYLNILHIAGWTIKIKFDDTLLPSEVLERYPNIPESYMDFLRRVSGRADACLTVIDVIDTHIWKAGGDAAVSITSFRCASRLPHVRWSSGAGSGIRHRGQNRVSIAQLRALQHHIKSSSVAEIFSHYLKRKCLEKRVGI